MDSFDIAPEELAMLQEMGTDLLTDAEAAQLSMLEPERPEAAWDDNLAEYLDETELTKIASILVERFERDDKSRAEWQNRERKGILMMGVSEEVEGGADFKGAAKVVHPMLVEACVQFQARAIAEMWPADGPVRTQVLGDITPERTEQAERVEGYLNYQYTEEIPDAFEETDRLLFRLPLSGSCFKKIYPDSIQGKLCAEFIEPAHFVAPYTATTLEKAPRYTHVILTTQNDLKKQQASGFYRQVDLVTPSEDAHLDTTVKDTIDASEGRARIDDYDDQRHTLLEMHVDYDVPGFEDQNEAGPTGIALPYIITIDKDSQKILAIRRNWREDDPVKKKRVWFVHYKFLPGLGFYGYGFLHILGGLSRAATGTLRALLDAAAFANMQGGYRSKDCKVEKNNEPLAPGEWRETEASLEDLQRGFFRVPYMEPSRTLFLLLGTLDEMGRRVAGTVESMVGDAANTGPVGTTVALIEQGLKVFSGVHKRLHQAAGREYKLVAELDREYMQEVYPYDVPGETREIKREDFDERIDVIPVSDPNMVSNTQRIAQAQAVLQLSGTAPDLYNREKAHRMMLAALRVPDIEELIPDRSQVPRMEPVQEGMAMLTMAPVKAYPDQDHQAHITVHQHMTIPEGLQEAVAPAVQAHIAEHYALLYMQQMQAAMDAEIPAGQELPPEEENQYAGVAASIYEAPDDSTGISSPDRPDGSGTGAGPGGW